MPFLVGESYTRDHIYAELGGEAVSSLPQRDGRVVCGCFSTDSNPEAPFVILVGGSADGEETGDVLRKARTLIRQGGSIPVFLKRSSDHWMYDGRYRVRGSVEDRSQLARMGELAGRDVALALLLDPEEEVRHAFLLTWNPKHWVWDDLERLATRTALGTPVEQRWSCGGRTHLPVGSRVFLLRQGVEPRGIAGAGVALCTPYKAPHWNAERREQGETALRIDVRFERILNPDVDDPLPLSKLTTGTLANVNWKPRMSGAEITDAVGDLERLWQDHLRLFVDGGDDAGEPIAVEGEVRLALRRHRARERWLRDAKVSSYTEAHGGRLPCEACGFDFFAVYGEVGRGYAQVHHLKPLGDRTRPSETKLGDLAVLCANCHAMIHREGKVLTLAGLVALATGV